MPILCSVDCVAAPKFRKKFTQKFFLNVSPKNLFKLWHKLYFQNFGKKEYIGEHTGSICNFSTDIFWGRKIAQVGGEILP